ncbi:unnamed protein product, partial [Adineta steineri]
NFKGALRDGIELHLTASEEKMPRFLLTATAKDGQQMEFKSITSITLGSRGLVNITNPHHLNIMLLMHTIYRISLFCLSFHRIITLLSSVLGQLSHFSLKLKGFTSISDPSTISDDIIQQL